MNINVVVADRLELVAAAIAGLVGSTPGMKIVGTGTTPAEILSLVKQTQPEVLLADSNLLYRKENGKSDETEIITQCLHHAPDLKIVVVTASQNERLPEKLMAKGVLGFVSKFVEDNELIKAINAVCASQRYISNDVTKKIFERSVRDKRKKNYETEFDILSPTEMKVAVMLSKGRKGKDVAKELGIQPKTVSTYRKRIYEKLQIDSDISLALLAFRAGIVDSESPID